MDGESEWNIPQAAVWIRTRDVGAVEALGDDALAITEAPYPDAKKAIACLLAALKAPFVVEGYRHPIPLVRATGTLVGNSIRLAIPLKYWCDGAELRLHFDDRMERLDFVAFRPAVDDAEWTSIAVRSRDCQVCWPPPGPLLAKPRPLEDAVRVLNPERVEHIPWLLTHPHVKVTGLNAEGERVEVDRPVLERGSITGNILATPSDGPRWWEVMLELRPATDALVPAEWGAVTRQTLPGSDIQPLSSASSDVANIYGARRRSGVKPRKLDATVDWLQKAYPHGLPADRKNEALVAELKAETGVAISVKTLRRAMSKLAGQTKGQSTDKLDK
jgi:hypothetical protein